MQAAILMVDARLYPSDSYVRWIFIPYGLFVIIPRPGSFTDDLYQPYAGEVTRAFGRGK